jgi:hypothetical protein
MKKLLLLTLTSFTLLFVQAQSPCDSLTVSGSQYQLTLTSVGIIDFWETTAPDGTILGQDSSWNMHSVYNISPSGAPYDTITTCLYTMNTVCCIIYFWNGNSWSIPGNAVASWDCNPNMLGCYDPGTGLGQYTSLAACQSNCGNVTDSFACMGGVAPGITTCVGPGVYTMGQTNIMSVYSTIAACIADSCNVMPPPSSWDCSPNLLGCYDPGTGLGQYTSMAACQSLCGTPIPSWDCNPNMLGCYDPGTGLGQYTSLAACQSNCGNVTDSFACMGGVAPGITTCVGPGVYTMGQTNIMSVYSTIAACIADSCNVMPPPSSWDCSPNLLGCYDPGTGLGQYTSMAACQAVCVSTVSNLCDSMTLFSTGGSPQTILMAQVLNINTIIASWITTAPDGTVLGVDSMSNSHQIFNNMNNGQPYDTINVCITYADAIGYSTCCVTWIWDANSGLWARMGSVTSIGEIGSFDKKLVKVVNLLGRETSINSNQTLFFIYEDGSIEKKFVIE